MIVSSLIPFAAGGTQAECEDAPEDYCTALARATPVLEDAPADVPRCWEEMNEEDADRMEPDCEARGGLPRSELSGSSVGGKGGEDAKRVAIWRSAVALSGDPTKALCMASTPYTARKEFGES